MSAPTLPGMPLAAEDLHVCHIDYGDQCAAQVCQPTAPAAGPIRALRPDETGAVWLILNLCRACNPRTGRYCTWHDTSRKFR